MKESKSESITVRVPTDLMNAVRKQATALGMGESISEIVKTALKAYAGMDCSNNVSENVLQRLEALERLVAAIDLEALKLEILESVSAASSDTHRYAIGAKLNIKELAEYLQFHPTNYTTQARKMGQSPDEYIEKQAIPLKESWVRSREQNKAIFTRVK